MFYDLKDKKPKNSGENWVAPNATIIGDVTLEKNSSIWFNAVLRGDIENIHIGEGSNIQDGSVLHTDPGCPLKVGKDVTVGHLVMLHGCTIGDNSLIGIGAVILNKVKIGKNCIIGAKALITENKVIPDNSLVVGSPGKVVREVTEEEKKAILENTKRYQDNWKKYSTVSILIRGGIMPAGYVIGIDYGGTKIEGILLDNNGAQIERKRYSYEKNYLSGIETVKKLVDEFDKLR